MTPQRRGRPRKNCLKISIVEQEELAGHIGVSLSAMQRYLRDGDVTASLSVALRIATWMYDRYRLDPAATLMKLCSGSAEAEAFVAASEDYAKNYAPIYEDETHG